MVFTLSKLLTMQYLRFVFLTVLALGGGLASFAQFGYTYGGSQDGLVEHVGTVCGYHKVNYFQVNTKCQLRNYCGGTSSIYHVDTPATAYAHGPLFVFTYPTGAGVLILNNRDSSSMPSFPGSLGYPMQYVFSTVHGQYMHMNQGDCVGCLNAFTPYYNPFRPLSYLREYSTDTSLSFSPTTFVDTGAGSLTTYHSLYDFLYDSVSFHLKNIVPPASYTAQTSIIASRIFRFNEYASINSPEETNPAPITALRGRPASYSFGYTDKENDSIRVSALQWRTIKPANSPRSLCSSGNFADTAYVRRVKNTLRDSVSDLAYRPGYSYTNPFGTGSSYALNQATGDISFMAPDTGIYLLTYRVTEYRDKKPLGDIMIFRVAYVADSTGITLPTVAAPSNVVGGNFDAANKVLSVCPGSQVSFSGSASSLLSGSKIVLASNLAGSCTNSTVSFSNQGGSNPSLSFSWMPTAADAGWHYVFVDAVDTGCGPGHKNVHVSYGFRILVQSKIKVAAVDTIACANHLNKLYLTSGNGQGVVQWSVLSGGDPQLGCATCDTLTVSPDSTTRYVATVNTGTCIFRDTIKVRITPRPVAGPITATPVAGVPGRYTFSGGTNGTTYSWSFGNGQSGTGTPVIYTYTLNGTYTVKLIATSTCGADTAYKTVVVTGLQGSGVGAILSENGVSIYPNPASEAINISSKAAIEAVRLTDAAGRVVLALKGNGKELTIPVKEFTRGIYTISVTTKSSVLVRQLVIGQ